MGRKKMTDQDRLELCVRAFLALLNDRPWDAERLIADAVYMLGDMQSPLWDAESAILKFKYSGAYLREQRLGVPADDES